MIKRILLIPILIISLAGCWGEEHREDITALVGVDFSSGEWLLVKEDVMKKNIRYIDDEKILEENKDNLIVDSGSKDGYATSYGSLLLYKNGELFSAQRYLDASRLKEPEDFRNAYRSAAAKYIYSRDEKDFQWKYDSILKLNNQYPAKSHIETDTLVIVAYQLYK